MIRLIAVSMIVNLLRKLALKLYLNLIGAVYVLKEQVFDRHRLPSVPPATDLQDTTVVITGGSKGIGLEAVKKLLGLGCNVIVGCRGVELARSRLQGHGSGSSAKLRILPLDLMRMESVREFAGQLTALNTPIHVLINNAGIMFGDRTETEEEGFEAQLATNYLGHFLLTHLLLPVLERSNSTSRPGRIVNVSSCAHYVGSWMDIEDLNLCQAYTPEGAYGNSKAAQIMFSQFLDSKLSEEGKIRVVALHPGVVYTDLYTTVWWVQIFTFLAKFMMKTASQGGDTILHAALATELDSAQTTGKYLENSRLSRISSFTASLENQSKLWEKTCQMLNIQQFGKP